MLCKQDCVLGKPDHCKRGYDGNPQPGEAQYPLHLPQAWLEFKLLSNVRRGNCGLPSTIAWVGACVDPNRLGLPSVDPRIRAFLTVTKVPLVEPRWPAYLDP